MTTTQYESHETPPYSLHDAKVCHAALNEGTLELGFLDDIMKLTQPYPYVRGKLLIKGIAPEHCAFYILSKNGVYGAFKGKKISIAQFIRRLENHQFEIVEEYNSGNRLTLMGFWNNDDDHSSCEAILNITYFSGKLIYVTDE